MIFLKNTFIYKAFHTDKKLFAVFVLYTLGLLYFALKQREEFPFLLFGMYSLKEETKPSYITYQIAVDGKLLETTKLKDAKAELITSPLSHIASSQNHESDSSNLAIYASWLLKYVGDGNSVAIHKLTCSFKSNGEPIVTNKELIYGNR